MPFQPPTPPQTLSLNQVSLNPAAPLSAVQPSSNPLVNAAIGAGPVAAINTATAMATNSPEIIAIAGTINIALDWIKNHRWFRENHWTVPLLFILSFLICGLVWYFFYHDIRQGIINAFGTIVNAHTNYAGAQVSGIGLLKPTDTANKYQGG